MLYFTKCRGWCKSSDFVAIGKYELEYPLSGNKVMMILFVVWFLIEVIIAVYIAI